MGVGNSDLEDCKVDIIKPYNFKLSLTKPKIHNSLLNNFFPMRCQNIIFNLEIIYNTNYLKEILCVRYYFLKSILFIKCNILSIKHNKKYHLQFSSYIMQMYTSSLQVTQGFYSNFHLINAVEKNSLGLQYEFYPSIHICQPNIVPTQQLLIEFQYLLNLLLTYYIYHDSTHSQLEGQPNTLNF